MQVLKPETSEAMRFIMRLNADRRARPRRRRFPATSSAARPARPRRSINGRYAKTRLFTTFMARASGRQAEIRVPDHHGRAAGGLPETYGFATAAWNAGAVTGKIIERVAPILGMPPRFEPPAQPFPLMARLGA